MGDDDLELDSAPDSAADDDPGPTATPDDDADLNEAPDGDGEVPAAPEAPPSPYADDVDALADSAGDPG